MEDAMLPRYRVTLTKEERKELEDITRRGKTHARRFIHARALLLCDAGIDGPAWNVADVATALGVSSRSIEHLKKRFVEDGLEAALDRKPLEISLACSEAPAGHQRWTVRLLADKAVELRFAETVSHMTVQRVLKKTNLSLTSANTGKSHRKGARPL
jgi:transposase